MWNVMKLSGGIGNQLFQYCTAYSFSKRFNVSMYYDLEEFERDELRSETLSFLGLKVKRAKKYHKLLFRKKIRDLWIFKYLKGPVVLIENDRDFIIELFQNESFFYFEGYWTNLKYFETNIKEINKEINVLEKYQTKPYKDLLYLINNTNSISIHIRRGDYQEVEFFNGFFGVLDLEYYLKAIKYFEQNTKDPVFYFFSDDIKWVKHNFSCVKNKYFVSELISGIDFLEFFLMKSCRHNIIANSTFSWWAAYLNDNLTKTVVQPRHWYKNELFQKKYENLIILNIENSIRI